MKNNTIQIRGEIAITVSQDNFGYFLSSCDQIDVHSWGQTQTQAIESLKETIFILFDDLIINGNLDTFLQESGWSKIETDNQIIILPKLLINTSLMSINSIYSQNTKEYA